MSINFGSSRNSALELSRQLNKGSSSSVTPPSRSLTSSPGNLFSPFSVPTAKETELVQKAIAKYEPTVRHRNAKAAVDSFKRAFPELVQK